MKMNKTAMVDNNYQVKLKILRYIFEFDAKYVSDYIGISRQYLSSIENMHKPLTNALKLAFRYLYENEYSEHLYSTHQGLPVKCHLVNRLDRMKYEDLLLANKYIEKRKKKKDFNIGDVINICDSTVIAYNYKGKIIYKHKEDKQKYDRINK